MKALRDRLEKGVLAARAQLLRQWRSDDRLPNTCNIAFEYVEGEAILLHLNRAGIAASSGSACTSGSLEPSHVLRAMNIPFTAAHGSIRFSLSRDNGDEEVDRVIEVLPAIIDKLRALSPFWAGAQKASRRIQARLRVRRHVDRSATAFSINDTTLRDGEQAPGVAFSAAEKARHRARAGRGRRRRDRGRHAAMGARRSRPSPRSSRRPARAAVMAWCRLTQADIDAALAAGVASCQYFGADVAPADAGQARNATPQEHGGARRARRRLCARQGP